VKRKVLIIVENQSVPPDPRVLNEARSLRANGYEVTVLCPRRKGYREGYQELNGIRIYRHPMPGEGHTPVGYLWEYGCALFWEFLYTCWIFLRHGFHVIQGCNPPDDIFLVALPFKLMGIKYIFDHHDANPELYFSKYERTGRLYKLLLWLEKMTYRFSDEVIVTNESYRDLATNRGHVPPGDVFVVRNGPDPRTFKAVPPKAALKNGKPYMVAYVGCMNVQDGLDILVEVAEYLKNLGRSDIRFVCVGRGPELSKLKRMVEEKALVDTVTFTGFIPDEDLLVVLSTADVCVNPDRPSEMNDISTMIKIMEYMTLGKPIVQFESKEGRFSAQEASLYADSAEPVKDFASKILWLLDRPEERKRMGEFGNNRIEAELAWDYSVKNLLAAYQRAFSKRGASNDFAQHGIGEKAARNREGATGDVRGTTARVSENDLDQVRSYPPYVLITPARNEEAFIRKTIESVISQTHRPLKWVIVDDGSTDSTPDIVRPYLAQHPWIEMVRRPQRRERTFAAKAHAFRAGYERVRDLPYAVIGNLDADISFDPDHFEFLLKQFPIDPALGVAGTVFKEENYSSDADSFEGRTHVAGQCQLFRKQCWEEIGGYTPHHAGGIDWMAVTTARMLGWKTRSFREKSFFHYRRLGTAERSVLSSLFSYGEKDYYLGGHPLWQFFRVAYRTAKRPYVLGGLALGAGYCWALLRRTPRPVSPELMAFHRKEQMTKLRAILTSLVTFKGVDTFGALPQKDSVVSSLSVPPRQAQDPEALQPAESKGAR
jgi:glycosyltransferase involved in cell wall biosynthesis